MNFLKDFAQRITNRDLTDWGYETFTKEEEQEAKENGIVICFGYSDDNIEFRGAYDNEYGCFEGGLFRFDGENVTNDKNADFFIKANWCTGSKWIDDEEFTIPWTYETNIPHEEYVIYDGGEPFCVGFVFYLKDHEPSVHSPKENEIIFAKTKPRAKIPRKEPENAGYDR